MCKFNACEQHSDTVDTDSNLCTDCTHNIGINVMDCEYGCSGVQEIKDEGRIVLSCSDYEKAVQNTDT